MSREVALVETDAVVATMSRARAALAEAKTIQETKRIVDAAAAAEIYAKRQKLGDEASDLALSIKVEALRKLGEMLHATPRSKARFNESTKSEPSLNDAPSLSDLGLTKKESAIAQKLAALSESDFQQVRDGHVTVSKAIAAIDTAKKTAPAARPGAKPKTAAEQERERIAEDANEGFDPLAELEAAQKENEQLAAELKATEADDLKAEALKWRRAYDAAVRAQSDAMDSAKRATDREAWTMRQLRRCGKAIGEDDPTKIAASVEAFARQYRKAA